MEYLKLTPELVNDWKNALLASEPYVFKRVMDSMNQSQDNRIDSKSVEKDFGFESEGVTTNNSKSLWVGGGYSLFGFNIRSDKSYEYKRNSISLSHSQSLHKNFDLFYNFYKPPL